MSTIDTSNIVNSTATTAAAAAAPTKGTAAATEDRFLKLLVSQLRNQDPLNPLDNAQVTSQMAQLSTVTGIDKLNDSIAGVLAAISALQPIQAAGLVGKDVAVQGDAIALASGTAKGGYSVTSRVDAMTVTVKDASGSTVRTIELGPQQPGIGTFAWDGKDANGKALPDGTYRFSIAATAGGKAADVTGLAVGRVAGVIPASDGFALNLAGVGIVPFANVAQIL